MNAIEIVFDWMLAASLRASALAVAILGIQLVLRRWLSAGWRHALWLPMVAVLVLPALPVGPFAWFPTNQVSEIATLAAPGGAHETPGLQEASGTSSDSGTTRTNWNALALVWFAGTCGVLLAGVVGYRRTMDRVGRAAIKADECLLGSVSAAAREAGLSRTPRVIVSTAVESPAVTGLLRPVLLLPAGFPNGFNATESRLILLHECTHLKRFDLPLNWLTCLLQAMHWFNPLLWFAFARMRADREAACDAQVLLIDVVDRRAEYGGALLKLQGMASSRPMSLGFVGIFERASEMKSRIVRISKFHRASPSHHALGGAACMSLILLGATQAEVSPSPDAAGKQKPKVVPANRAAAALEEKLKKIVIPQAAFEGATLEQAVDFIRLRSQQLDAGEANPAKRGVNFVIRKPQAGADGKAPRPYGLITLNLKNVPLDKLIRECALQSGTRSKVDEYAINFVPADEPEIRPAVAPPAPKGIAVGSTSITGKVADVANKIIIPKADLGDLTLQEAVDYLNQQAKEIVKGEPPVLLVIDPKVDASVRTKELRLKNVPLGFAASYCAVQTRLRLVAGDKEIRFMKW